jgi:hypothetical protein
MKTTQLRLEEIIDNLAEESFNEFSEEFELDPSMTLEDILFEVYCSGFEQGILLELEEEEE